MSRWLKIAGISLIVVIVIAGLLVGWTYRTIARSVALLDGEIEVSGVESPVSIERDALGVPAIRGSSRLDVARGLGFVHAQERFFQMDLMRRQAAGELSEIFGAGALPVDRASRLHQFRQRARLVTETMSETEHEVVEAYAAGVNSGLETLREKPFEYVLLRAEPAPWRTEDSVLVLYAMYFVLNDDTGDGESDLGLLEDLLPAEMAAFLAPLGTEWDAPVVGEAFETPPIPDVEVPLDEAVAASHDGALAGDLKAEALVGSNNWAVGGSLTADGRAILANDMHLGMAVPNTWYRALLEWPAEDGCGSGHRLIGVTLPGSPAVVAGSNTRVAWGFTNSQGDWSDLVIVETAPDDPDRYLTPDGWLTIENHTETIVVRDGEAEPFNVRTTIWGPIVDQDHLGRSRAVRWIAHDQGGANLVMLDLEHVATVPEALEVANRAGIPPQNFVCADADGNIGWTILGRIPRRFGFSGRVPTSWADGSHGWDGWLAPEDYPRVINPANGIIWTANARVVSDEMLKIVGHGGYDLGARAHQIRDDLLALENPDEKAMLAVQLDDRALFLERWRSFLLELLDGEAVGEDPKRGDFRELIESTWTGRASIDSQGFRLVRGYRAFAFERIYGRLTSQCEEKDEGFNFHRIQQAEGPLWRLITEQPPHFRDPKTASWREELLEIVDSTISYYETDDGAELEDQTWGARNRLSMQHPLSRAIPALSRWLDMPRRPLPGDSDMPRVQSPGWGASERLAVSPGREAEGYFHMPAGQSGHPLSPFFGAGHNAWVEGLPTPLLPGTAEFVLTLVP
ncbi:penicillin acylase family protein [Acidobacteriota bacterium]